MEIYQGLDVSADQVIVVNNHDKNSEILSYIERKGIPFSYYKSDTSSMSWSAPTIGFYDESGQLVKADFGGSNTNLVFKCRINKLSLSKVCKGEK